MEEMRLEMERMKEEAKKEAEETLRMKVELNSTNECDLANLRDENQRLKRHLSTAQKQLVEEQQRSRDVLTSMTGKEAELKEAQVLVDKLRCEIGALQSQVITGIAVSDSDKEEEYRRKLEDALAESAERGKEIKRLKKEFDKSSKIGRAHV